MKGVLRRGGQGLFSAFSPPAHNFPTPHIKKAGNVRIHVSEASMSQPQGLLTGLTVELRGGTPLSLAQMVRL